MLRLRQASNKQVVETRGATKSPSAISFDKKHERRGATGLRKRRRKYKVRRQTSQASLSPHVVILSILIIVTVVEALYLYSSVGGGINAVNLFIWDSLVSTIERSTTTSFWTTYPIDDYYSRPHIRNQPALLVVGGSDGSGTRAFASILEQLDVPMVVDDRGTMDVHAKEMFNGQGWPPLVSTLLEVTHSATYDVDDLPMSLKQLVIDELGRLMNELEKRGLEIVNKATKAGRKISTSVSWGFKAPVSMLLLPFLKKNHPALKFIHIVRDGRDIALSDNHSPVQKFFDAYFPDAAERTKSWREGEDFGDNTIQIIKAMQLWNDWNQKVYAYSLNEADGKSLDVLVVRAEDLIENPFETIMRLADFVGSPKPIHDICCLSQKQMEDLGKSGFGLRGGRDRIHKMFGPNAIENLNRRFEALAPDWGSSEQHELERKNPTPSWDHIRKKVLEIENGENPAGYLSNNAHRRLQEETESDDMIEIALPKEMPRSAIDMMKLSQYAAENADVGATSYDQIRLQMENALQQRHDVGYSTSTGSRTKTTNVKERYGKWARILESSPKLSDILHFEGKDALELFGYEPPRIFMDAQANSGFKCDDTVVCGA